jgi:hypothetical protein
MSGLKALSLIAAPIQVARDPKLVRREKLLAQLDQQLSLARDEEFVVRTKRWIRQDDGSKVLTERVKRVNRWWRDDGKGGCFMVLRYGNKLVELAPGKTAVAVGSKDKLESVIVTVMNAVSDGELDGAISVLQGRLGRKKSQAA